MCSLTLLLLTTQLEVLDFLMCIITPLVYAQALEKWPLGLLPAVYCCVLAIKGYQLALLSMSAANEAQAHRKARWAGCQLLFVVEAMPSLHAAAAALSVCHAVQHLPCSKAATLGSGLDMLFAMSLNFEGWSLCDDRSAAMFVLLHVMQHLPPPLLLSRFAVFSACACQVLVAVYRESPEAVCGHTRSSQRATLCAVAS